MAFKSTMGFTPASDLDGGSSLLDDNKTCETGSIAGETLEDTEPDYSDEDYSSETDRGMIMEDTTRDRDSWGDMESDHERVEAGKSEHAEHAGKFEHTEHAGKSEHIEHAGKSEHAEHAGKSGIGTSEYGGKIADVLDKGKKADIGGKVADVLDKGKKADISGKFADVLEKGKKADIGGKIGGVFEKGKEKMKGIGSAEIPPAGVSDAGAPVYHKAPEGTREMWSWLKQESKRQIYYTPDQRDLTENEYMSSLAEKMEKCSVPAGIEHAKIQWDLGASSVEGYFVRPDTRKANPLSYIVQFNHVGDFTIVDEKTFITPPDLPKVPSKPIPDNKNQSMTAAVFLLLGLAAFYLGRTSRMPTFNLVGIVLLVMGGALMYKYYQVMSYNKKCAAEEAAWNAAWNSWQNNNFQHAFQEDTSGGVSRIYAAVFECIKQVNDEVFKSEKVESKEESYNMSEIEQMIARRREEYR